MSKTIIWTGRVISALVFLGMSFAGVMKLIQPGEFAKQWEQSGYDLKQAAPIGIMEMVCAVLYIIPQTSVLGAILVACAMGGATATNVRLHQPIFIPVLVGVLAWLGLLLREPRLRPLLPLRR